MYPAQQLPQQTLQHGRGVGGHEEIILVSDDRVLTLRMALPAMRVLGGRWYYLCLLSVSHVTYGLFVVPTAVSLAICFIRFLFLSRL